jgi:hypothetical protein
MGKRRWKGKEIVRATQALLGVHSTPSDTWVRCVVERHIHVKK